MYVLYYFQEDYDGGECRIIYVSSRRGKLEDIRKEFDDQFHQEQFRVNELNKQREAYLKRFREDVRAYLTENLDHILDYDVNAQRTKAFIPTWCKEYRKQYKMELIDKYVDSSIAFMFSKAHGLKIWEKILDYGKVKLPPPFMDLSKTQYHSNPYKENLSNLFIDYVEELD